MVGVPTQKKIKMNFDLLRLLSLYRKAKKGDNSAFFALKKMGLDGTKIEVLRAIQEIFKQSQKEIPA
jgi:hypothetical protein